MGFLTVFSETGCPHSGCLLEYSGSFEWLSFMPRAGSFFDVFPGGNYGTIDTSDRETAIDTYARFRISDDVLSKGRNTTIADYAAATYGLFINDCCSFSSDLSKNCGLKIPPTAFMPSVLVEALVMNNYSNMTHQNKKPYPWIIYKKPPKESK